MRATIRYNGGRFIIVRSTREKIEEAIRKYHSTTKVEDWTFEKDEDEDGAEN